MVNSLKDQFYEMIILNYVDFRTVWKIEFTIMIYFYRTIYRLCYITSIFLVYPVNAKNITPSNLLEYKRLLDVLIKIGYLKGY